MAMTRKHFNAIAQCFRDTEHLAVMHPAARKLWYAIQLEIAGVCAESNDYFDASRFASACYNKPEDYEGVSDE